MAQLARAGNMANDRIVNVLLENVFKSVKSIPTKRNSLTALRTLKLLRAKHPQILKICLTNLKKSKVELSLEEKILVSLTWAVLKGNLSDAKDNNIDEMAGHYLPKFEEASKFLEDPSLTLKGKVDTLWMMVSAATGSNSEQSDITEENVCSLIEKHLGETLPEDLSSNQRMLLLMSKQSYEYCLLKSSTAKTDQFMANYKKVSDLLLEGLKTRVDSKLTKYSNLETTENQKSIEPLLCYVKPEDPSKKVLYAHPMLLAYDRSTFSGLGRLQLHLVHYDEILFDWMLG